MLCYDDIVEQDWRMEYADLITVQRIRYAHPAVRAELLLMYLAVNTHLLGKGVRLRFSHVWRSPEEQNRLFKKRPKVTNAKAWESTHQYGLAFDIVLLYDNDGNGTFEEASWNMMRDGDGDGVADWIEVTKYFEAEGWKNGFVRNGAKWDFPHFEKNYGLDWRDMKAKLESEYTEEVIDGKTFKWILIEDND